MLFKQDWIVLILLIAVLGWLYCMMLTRINLQVYEAEDLLSNFTGEINSYDKFASNTYARYVNENTQNNGGKAIFYGPYIDLKPGVYRIVYNLRGNNLKAAKTTTEKLKLDVVNDLGRNVIASREIHPRQQNSKSYQSVAMEFSLNSHISGVELRAFYPGEGEWWFDNIVLRRKTPWDFAWIQFPLVAILLTVLLFFYNRIVKAGLSLNEVLNKPKIQQYLRPILGLALLAEGLYVFGRKYFFDIERIVYAYVPDDVFYYFETAANIARHGKISFDGGITFGNGFHPLWNFMLVPIYWLGLGKESSFLVGLALGDVIGLGAILLLFWTLKRRFNVFLAFGLSHCFFRQVQFRIQSGLESALLICLFITLLSFYDVHFKKRFAEISYRSFALLGALLGFLFLSRLDHALVVLVFLAWFFVSHQRWVVACDGFKKLALMLGIAAIFVVPYLSFNYIATGHFVPTSGMIKSMDSNIRLMAELNNKSYFEAKLDNFIAVLESQRLFFWSLTGSLFIFWVPLSRCRFARYKNLFPFVLGPAAIFGYYTFCYHQPGNLYFWYYPTILLAGLLAIGIVADWLLDHVRVPDRLFLQRIIVCVLVVGFAYHLNRSIGSHRTFFRWVKSTSFENYMKYHSWRAAEYVQNNTWPAGQDGRVVFASADAGVIGWRLDEPVVNVDGLINNEILDYRLQGKNRYQYMVDKSEIDYFINVLHKDFSPPDEFARHFELCYKSSNFTDNNLGFRIYGRKKLLPNDDQKDNEPYN